MRSLLALLVAIAMAGCPLVAENISVSENILVSENISESSHDVVEYRVDPSLEGWHFPRLRTTYRVFLMPPPEDMRPLMADELQRGDVPMACALLLSATRAGLAVDEEVAELVRMAAVESLARGDIRWGAQPLLMLAANPTMNASSRAMAETLLDQLEPDDVKGNAFASCELYLVGLQEDWDTWLTVLLDRCARRVRTPTGEWSAWDQPQTLLSSLALLAAAHGAEGLSRAGDSWWFLAYGNNHDWFAGFSQANDQQKRALLQLARHWIVGYANWGGEHEFHAARGNRRLAWYILEGMFPHSADMLQRIALDEDMNWYYRRRALAVLMVHDPTVLLSGNGRTVLPAVVAAYNGHYHWPLSPLAMDWRVDDIIGGCWDPPKLVSLVHYEPTWRMALDARSRLMPHREALLQQVRDRLKGESNPQQQLNLAAFLTTAGDESAEELIGAAIVSNLVDDDVWGNRERAHWLTRGEEHNDAMHVALSLGTEMRDWQMVTDALQHLMLYEDPNILIGRRDVALLLLDQLADDNIPGNATAAYAVLRDLDRDGVRWVFSLREPRDEQERSYRAGLGGE